MTPPVGMDEPDPSVCAQCGCAVESGAVEDTNGWRWYSDGRGGLLPLCPSCPVPADVAVGER